MGGWGTDFRSHFHQPLQSSDSSVFPKAAARCPT